MQQNDNETLQMQFTNNAASNKLLNKCCSAINK